MEAVLPVVARNLPFVSLLVLSFSHGCVCQELGLRWFTEHMAPAPPQEFTAGDIDEAPAHSTTSAGALCAPSLQGHMSAMAMGLGWGVGWGGRVCPGEVVLAAGGSGAGQP